MGRRGGQPDLARPEPHHLCSQWKTPMLLSIGERFSRADQQYIENWSALQRMHVPSRLLVWPDAWHWITKPEDSRHFYEEVHKWLAVYLKDSPCRLVDCWFGE